MAYEPALIPRDDVRGKTKDELEAAGYYPADVHEYERRPGTYRAPHGWVEYGQRGAQPVGCMGAQRTVKMPSGREQVFGCGNVANVLRVRHVTHFLMLDGFCDLHDPEKDPDLPS